MKENIIKYNSFNESKTSQSNKSIIFELCVSMILLNPEFLDNILDRGSKSRYMENSQIFLTDLKNQFYLLYHLKILCHLEINLHLLLIYLNTLI